MSRRAPFLVTLLLTVGFVVEAVAGVRIQAQEVRSYELPSELDPGQAMIQSDREGTTVIAGTMGQG
ncbi:MAG: hypothetical protein ACNA8W_20655, partial [Bradymonadaceae bacterium]